MIKKKFMILAIFLVILLAVSAVSAADNATGDIGIIEETTNEVVSVENNDVILKENNYVGTFTELANDIINAGNELNLTKNYIYTNDDYNYNNGIIIDKSITINGNGFTINGNYQTRVFNITAPNVILSDIYFVKCSSSAISYYDCYSCGGAIYWGGDNGTLFNCNFVNSSSRATSNSSLSYCCGGAIYWAGSYGNIYNCSFINSSSNSISDTKSTGSGYNNRLNIYSCGGAIYWAGSYGNIYNCSFINSSSNSTFTSKSSSGSNTRSPFSCGGTIYWRGSYGTLYNCSFIKSSQNSKGRDSILITKGGAVYWEGTYGTLYNNSFLNSFSISDGISVYWNGTNGVLFNNTFANISGNGGEGNDKNGWATIYWTGDNGTLFNCNFMNCLANRAGAVYWWAKNGTLYNCNFMNCSSFTRGIGGSGAISVISDNFNLYDCNFVNCFVFHRSTGYYELYSGRGGAVDLIIRNNGTLYNCNFVNCSSPNYGGAICLSAAIFDDDGMEIVSYSEISLFDCCFVNCFAAEKGSAIYWEYPYGIISNCSFVNCLTGEENGAIYLIDEEYSQIEDDFLLIINNSNFHNNNYGSVYCNVFYTNIIINNSWFDDNHNNFNVVEGSLIVIKRIFELYANSTSCNYQNATFNATLKNNGIALTNKEILFNFTKENTNKIFTSYTNDDGVALLSDELKCLDVGLWVVSIFFDGYDNYVSSNLTTKITINPPSSSLTIEDVNATVGYKTTLIANVNSTFTVNEGTVTFFDGNLYIGERYVEGGVATLTYTPETAGEHKITAVFNSDNYLSSNSTAELLVDSATVEVLADTGTVGFESNFVANVKGLYSIINEGNVYFYIDDEYIGKDKVVDGVATLTYTPLIADEYTVSAVYTDSVNFLNTEDSTVYTVNQADSQTIINDINGTVGHELTITADIVSSNNLTINEGTVTFYDDETYIGESDVYNGIATLTYAPTTAGEHIITAMYHADNYQDSNNSALLSVVKANVDLGIDYIADVYFTEQSRFTVNVNSNSKAVNEGEVKYYVNDILVGSSDVYNGVSSFSYAAKSVGFSVLKVVYEGTDNYLASDATSIFTVNKMPTSLSGETAFFDEDQSKIYTTTLTDVNGHGVYNQKTKIEVIKYSGESRTFQSRSDSEGVTSYDINALAGGMWIVRGIFEENDNYVGSSFTDRFIVIRMNTTTAIEEIVNPRVNHTYKLKANIHDENGKLVKEGIVQFYLDGVDIGSIDLSENQGHQTALRSGLLGAGEDDEPYLEYTPTKAGSFTLSAVYEGTTVYKSSNSTTDFVVREDGKNATRIAAPDVTTVYNSGGELVATLINDDTGKVMSSINLIVKLNNEVHTLKTNSKGEVRLSTDGLLPNTYTATIIYKGSSKYDPSSTTAKVTVNKLTSIVSAEDVNVRYGDANGKLVATLTNAEGVPLSANVVVTLNGVSYTLKSNSAGQVSVSTADLAPGSYVATIVYKGNSKYASSSTAAEVVVTDKLVSIVTADDITVKYGDANGKLIATLTNAEGTPLSANIVINLNGVNYALKTNSKGLASVSTADLNPGEYIATVTYKGNSKYAPSSTTAKVTVTNKLDSVVSAEDVTVRYGDVNGKLIATLTNAEGVPLSANIVINLNGVDYAMKTNSKGQGSVSTKDLAPGTYTATITYKGNSKYAPSSTTAKVTVTDKLVSVVSADDVTVRCGDSNGKLIATLTNAEGTPLSANIVISLNGVDYAMKTNSKGQASVSTKDLAVGEYTATITYKGNSKYAPSSTTAKVTVNNKLVSVVTASDVTVKQGDANGKLIATLTNAEGTPLSANMVVSLNGVDYALKSNSKGNVAVPTADLAPGEYTATITYKGNSKYNPSTTTAKVTVTDRLETCISGVYNTETKEVIGTLTNAEGVPLSANVVVSLNGVNYALKSDSKGQFKVSAADLAPGKYTAKLVYKGNSKYGPSSATVNVVIP